MRENSIQEEADGISVSVDLEKVDPGKAVDVLNGVIARIRERRK